MRIVLVGLVFATAVLAADPFVGTWKINVEKSTSTDPAADRAQIGGRKLIYEAVSPNSYRITAQRPDRTARMLARMDGQDYSNDSDGRDYEKDSTLPVGTGTFTIAWQRIDESHQLLIFKKNRKEYSRRDTSVSPDGKLLTLRQRGLGRSDGKPFDNTLVFDKEVTGAAVTEQRPPVYFNHTDVVLDPAVYDAIAQSPFLKAQFSFFDERTIQRPGREGTYSYTFVGICGRQTYFGFFKPGQIGWATDQINFNMWIDDRTKLPLIRDSLARQTQTEPAIQPIKAFVDGRSVNAFDTTRAEFPNHPENVGVATSVFSRYADYITQRYPNVKPEQYSTTREKDQALGKRYLPERLLNDITRFTLTVNKTEAEQLLQEFEAYGYAIRRDGEKQIVTGPEIEFVLLNAEPGSPRKLAIDMKLNRPKTGDQNLQFGSGSELRFNGDTATWYFPSGWRP